MDVGGSQMTMGYALSSDDITLVEDWFIQGNLLEYDIIHF